MCSAQAIFDELRTINHTVNDCAVKEIENTDPNVSESKLEGCGMVRMPAQTYQSTEVVNLWKQVARSLADNIVRKYVDGAVDSEPEVESYYDVDPRSPDFDRVTIQRYGALAAADPTSLDADVQIDGTTVFSWKSAWPETRLRRARSGQPTVPTQEYHQSYVSQLVIELDGIDPNWLETGCTGQLHRRELDLGPVTGLDRRSVP